MRLIYADRTLDREVIAVVIIIVIIMRYIGVYIARREAPAHGRWCLESLFLFLPHVLYTHTHRLYVQTYTSCIYSAFA